MRRKLFCYTLFVMAGILCGFWFGKAVLFLSLLLLFLAEKYADARILLLAFFIGALLLFLFEFRFTHGVYHNDSGSKESAVTGIVLDVEKQKEASYRLTIDADGEKILAAYYQELETPWKLLGKKISFYAEISLPAEAGNPRTFDYRRYLLNRGIEYICTIDRYTVDRGEPSMYYRIKSRILEKRASFQSALSIGGRAEGVLGGLLFGDKNQIDENLYEAFHKNGTAHVLAVSGLHIGILYSIYRWIYNRWKRRWITAVFLGFLFVYGTTALWSVSVTRAIGLIVLVVLGRSADRRYDLLTSLSAMALLSMVRNPYVIFDAGFQMSFLAVLSITFLQKPFAKYVGESWAVAFSVQTGLLPYMAYTFNYVSFAGILYNVPVIFLTSVLVPVGMTGFTGFLLFGSIIPGLPQVLESVANLLIWCNERFAAEGIPAFDIVSPPPWLIILIYGVMFLGTSEYFHIYFYRKDIKKIFAMVLLFAVCMLSGCLSDRTPFDKAELVFVDVGQGDCLHIKTPDGRQLLIDGGGKSGYNTGEKILKPYLLKNRIRKIDLAAVTHLHTDHFAGLEELADCYPVKQMVTEGQAGQKIVIEEDWWLEILWPKVQNPETDDENLNSLIFMVHHDGLKTLITGDITAEGESMLLEAYRGTDRLRADILKVAHHGSAYSTSDAFLDAVKPKAAVISVGKNNYGHPSEIVIEKLKENGIMVFRTDLDGAVGIINRKGTLSVCTEKQR